MGARRRRDRKGRMSPPDPTLIPMAEAELENAAHAFAGIFRRWIAGEGAAGTLGAPPSPDSGVMTAEPAEVTSARIDLYRAAVAYVRALLAPR